MAEPTPTQLAIREAQAKLDEIGAKRADVLEARKLALLNARVRFEQELGPGGEAFQLIDANEHGPIVVAPPETGGLPVLLKAFNKSIEAEQKKQNNPHGGVTEEACLRFVLPCVKFPERAVFQDILEKAPGVLFLCTKALQDLASARAEIDQGK
jgi:hypothetical protein